MRKYSEFDNCKWYGKSGTDNDVVLSTRVRIARNLKDYPFGSRLSDTGAAEIIEKVKSALPDCEFTDFGELPPNAAASFAERHIISREFAYAKNKKALLTKPDSGIYVMVGEEDHIRIQSIVPGMNFEQALKNALEIEGKLDEKLNIAYSEKFGYITHCPTNLGTGMRASVMLHLPAISAQGEITALRNQLAKLGLTVRGMSGEGSHADCSLFQVSNQITLGITEEETIKKLRAVTESIVKRERELRGAITGDALIRLRDKVRRAIGTIRYAELMDTREFMSLYSTVRLGAALGMTDGVKCEVYDNMLFSTMPATLVCESDGKIKTSFERDMKRAEKLREISK